MLFAARSLLLLALTFSSMLAVDYSSDAPLFCGADGGCGAVRQSGYGEVLGVSMPLWGLVGLGALLLLSLLRHGWARHMARAGAALAVAAGVALVVLQVAIIGAVCPYCLVVDVASVLAGALLLARLGASGADPLRPFAWALLGALAVAAPALFPRVVTVPELPPGIAALQSPDGLTVVEFADFQCPFCRHLYPRLKQAIEAQPEGSVHVVHRNVPLPFHRHARGAALAQICAEAQGAGEAMVDHLFGARSLAPAANREAASELGLDLEAYDACLASDAAAAQLEEQIALFDATGQRGLPTTYIGDRVLSGAQGDPEIARLFQEARRQRGISASAFAAIVATLAALVLLVGRRRAG